MVVPSPKIFGPTIAKTVDTTENITSINNTETSAPNIEIGVSGKILSFPFKYEDLEKESASLLGNDA